MEHDSCFTKGMVDRDFFGFCITLKPLELKALGQLSQTRHLAAGETIYAPGDPGDILFIVNRGVVEAVRSTAKNVSDTYLSRGDIFGDVEVLTERPRKYLVRTRESVSLQCFHREDFPELIRRVPSFFQYLSEQLAFRLAQARDLALAQSDGLELSGSLSNFDLVTIYQTIVNSSQTGELRICNEKSDLIAAFCFERGRPRCGQFEHLTGTFSSSSGDGPVSGWIKSEPITRNADDMLINALQGRDEFHDLKERMPHPEEKLHRRKSNLSWSTNASPDLQPIAEQIWPLSYKGPVTLASLFRSCTFCQLKIYQVVDELVQSKHFECEDGGSVPKVA
jgi:CRP-like cAMP-binding protein